MVHSPDPFTRSALLHALASVQRAAEHSARSAACVLASGERPDGNGGVALVELRSCDHAQLVGMLQLLSATLPDGELCARRIWPPIAPPPFWLPLRVCSRRGRVAQPGVARSAPRAHRGLDGVSRRARDRRARAFRRWVGRRASGRQRGRGTSSRGATLGARRPLRKRADARRSCDGPSPQTPGLRGSAAVRRPAGDLPLAPLEAPLHRSFEWCSTRRGRHAVHFPRPSQLGPPGDVLFSLQGLVELVLRGAANVLDRCRDDHVVMMSEEAAHVDLSQMLGVGRAGRVQRIVRVITIVRGAEPSRAISPRARAAVETSPTLSGARCRS